MTRVTMAALALLLLAQPAMADNRSVVFFRSWSARLDPSALAVIAGAATKALANRSLPISVVGAADPDGSAEANRLLSRLRAQVVKDALVQDGVAARRITVRGIGAVPFSQSGLESRRAIITVGKR